jgi:hypothetical protein
MYLSSRLFLRAVRVCTPGSAETSFALCRMSCSTICRMIYQSETLGRITEISDIRTVWVNTDRLCGLVVRVSGYRSRGPGFDSRRFQIFWEALGLEQGPLSLVRTTEELLGRNISGFGQENRDWRSGGSAALTTQHPLSAKVGTTSPTSGGRSVGIVW